MSSTDTPVTPSVRPRRNRNWVWALLVVAALGLSAIVVNWLVNSVYYAAEPLTPERLRDARNLWQRNHPADYDLKIIKSVTYSSADGTEGTMVDKFELQVRGGKVVSFLVNEREPEPLLDAAGKRNLDEERRQRESYDIPGLFDAMEEFMERDKRDKIPSATRARFDRHDGHIILFVRMINGKRVPHIQVEVRKPKSS
jgi:hypothetical protein